MGHELSRFAPIQDMTGTPNLSPGPAITVVFVAGAGRSGSTLLDTILGNHPLVESVGELANVQESAWSRGEYCACGQRGNDCGFWTDVLEAWTGSVPGVTVDDFLRVQRRVERLRSYPNLRFGSLPTSRDFELYKTCITALYRAISHVSGKPIVVDSSKLATRGFALSLVPGINLKVIHLVRDPRGVAWSLTKSFERNEAAGLQRDIAPRPVIRSVLLWMLANLLAGSLRKMTRERSYMRVRYEDLVADLAGTLGRIGELMELDLGSIVKRTEHDDGLVPGHTVAGNRMRMQRRIRVSLDKEWIEKLPRRDRWLIQALAFPQMITYGYL